MNELLVREDKVTDEQVNRCLVDKPLYNKYLVCRSTCLLVNFKNLVPMLLCLLLTLSTSNLLTCQLVHSSTLKTLFLCYFVFYLPVYKQLVYSSTCSLVYSPILSTFFKHLESERWSFGFLKTPFWIAKGAL